MMKNTQLSNNFNVLGLLGAALLLPACSTEEGSEPALTGASAGLHILARVGEGDAAASYLAPTTSWREGRVTLLGQGTELGRGFSSAISFGPHIYVQDFGERVLEQLRPDGRGGYEEITSLVLSALTETGRFRIMEIVDQSTLFLMTWPNPAGTVDYVFVDIPALSVRSRGSFSVEPVDGIYAPVEVGSPVIVGDKVYLGTMYWVESTQAFSTSLHTLVLDYPSMSNPVRFSSPASVGSTGGWAKQSMFQDEEGHIYQHNIRSKFWYNMGTAEDKPTLITRIRAGEMEYDESYSFDVSSQFSETVSLIALTYVGNGIAYGAMLWEDRSTDWGEAFSQNRGFIARIDLRARTAEAMSLPDSPVLQTGVPLVKDGLFYMPIAPVGQQARVFILDPARGVEGAEPGLMLDGNNLQVGSLLETTAQ